MKSVLDAVSAFMDATQDARPAQPELPPPPTRDLRKRLLQEEFDEYLEGEENDDIVEISDALADMIYIIAGTALKYGIPLDEVFAEVQRSNMEKFPNGRAVIRPDGKILKPEGWKPPDIRAVLETAGYRG